MYAHLGYYLHQIAFKDVSIIANDKVILDHADVMIFDIYFGALVVYLLLALVYYRVRNIKLYFGFSLIFLFCFAVLSSLVKSHHRQKGQEDFVYAQQTWKV